METLFGPPAEWPGQDLIAFSEEFDPALTLAAYRSGVFPMPLQDAGFDGLMGWWSPVERAHLPLDGLRLSRSLRKSVRRYTTTVDRSFQQVITACGSPERPDGWIDSSILATYTALHGAGLVHSVETWDEQGRLVGGLYGLHQQGLFAGESMFHHPQWGTDASKVALVRLVVELARVGVELLDVQWLTPHLQSLGAVAVGREAYLEMLEAVLQIPHANRWRRGEGSRLGGQELLDELEVAHARTA